MAKTFASAALQLLKSPLILNSHPERLASSSSAKTMGDTMKPREMSMTKKLTEMFKPAVLEIINESYMHSVPKGSETHFKVIIVADAFEGVSLVQRHRLVNTALGEEFATGLHALSIVAKTPSQWEGSDQKFEKSPPCRGGAGL